jgi:hypothetical protein
MAVSVISLDTVSTTEVRRVTTTAPAESVKTTITVLEIVRCTIAATVTVILNMRLRLRVLKIVEATVATTFVMIMKIGQIVGLTVTFAETMSVIMTRPPLHVRKIVRLKVRCVVTVFVRQVKTASWIAK